MAVTARSSGQRWLQTQRHQGRDGYLLGKASAEGFDQLLSVLSGLEFLAGRLYRFGELDRDVEDLLFIFRRGRQCVALHKSIYPDFHGHQGPFLGAFNGESHLSHRHYFRHEIPPRMDKGWMGLPLLSLAREPESQGNPGFPASTPSRARTYDPRIKSPLLYQLSYRRISKT